MKKTYLNFYFLILLSISSFIAGCDQKALKSTEQTFLSEKGMTGRYLLANARCSDSSASIKDSDFIEGGQLQIDNKNQIEFSYSAESLQMGIPDKESSDCATTDLRRIIKIDDSYMSTQLVQIIRADSCKTVLLGPSPSLHYEYAPEESVLRISDETADSCDAYVKVGGIKKIQSSLPKG